MAIFVSYVVYLYGVCIGAYSLFSLCYAIFSLFRVVFPVCFIVFTVWPFAFPCVVVLTFGFCACRLPSLAVCYLGRLDHFSPTRRFHSELHIIMGAGRTTLLFWRFFYSHGAGPLVHPIVPTNVPTMGFLVYVSRVLLQGALSGVTSNYDRVLLPLVRFRLRTRRSPTHPIYIFRHVTSRVFPHSTGQS